MGVIKKPKAKIRGGAHVPHHKDTAEGESVRMQAPARIVLPMRQHIGVYCKPVVTVGEQVKVGQVVGDDDALLVAPIHSPISGTVRAIEPYLLARGTTVDAVIIDNDGDDALHPEIQAPKIENLEDFLLAVRQSGLVGIGGAGFPTHVKLATKDEIEILLINAAECEPYITSDYREIMENHHHVLEGIRRVMQYRNIPKCIIGIECNKPKAIALLAREIKAKQMEAQVTIVELPAHYPHGAEKQLIYAATGRIVPLGALPSSVHVMMLNVSSVSVLNYYLDTGIPLVRKRMTVAGAAIKHPQNVFVPIGATIEDVVQVCGGFTQAVEKIIMGGPMMGVAQYDLKTPVFKQNNALLCFGEEENFKPKENPCIRCGRCVSVCPMRLLPTELELAGRKGDIQTLKRLGMLGCMECGSCAYACPAHRPLVQYLKQAKQVVRTHDAKG